MKLIKKKSNFKILFNIWKKNISNLILIPNLEKSKFTLYLHYKSSFNFFMKITTYIYTPVPVVLMKMTAELEIDNLKSED